MYGHLLLKNEAIYGYLVDKMERRYVGPVTIIYVIYSYYHIMYTISKIHSEASINN